MSVQGETVLTVDQIAEQIGGSVVGDGSKSIHGVNSIAGAGDGEITFVTSDKHASKLADSSAGAVIVSSQIEGVGIPQVVVSNAGGGLIAALHLFAYKPEVKAGIHPSAIVQDDAEIGEGASISERAYVGHNVKIGCGAVISAGCVISDDSVIGAGSRLDPNVVVYHHCVIGDKCVIQANSTIGSTGYGYYPVEGMPRLIPHSGSVIIEDCVELGANCCIDRAKFGNTVIGAGSKLDNHVHIGHNVQIGKCCLLAAQVGIAGSAIIGDGVMMGGQAGMGDNMTIGAGAMIGGGTGVTRSLEGGGKYFGYPVMDAKELMQTHALTKRLPEMRKQLKQLMRDVKKLQADIDKS